MGDNLDVCSLVSITYLNFMSGRRWDGDMMADERDRATDKDEICQAMDAFGEYSVEEYYRASRVHLERIFTALASTHRFKETAQEYWSRRVRTVAKGHASGMRKEAPPLMDMREVLVAMRPSFDKLVATVGASETERLRGAIQSGEIYDVETSVLWSSDAAPIWWPRPGRVGLWCSATRNEYHGPKGMVLQRRVSDDNQETRWRVSREWRGICNGFTRAMGQMRALQIRLRKPAWADLSALTEFTDRLEAVPRLAASQFPKNEVSNDRVLTSVEPMGNEIARFVLGEEDQQLKTTGLTDSGFSPEETLRARWDRRQHLCNQIHHGIFASLCSDYANFQNGHSRRLLKLHWATRLKVVDVPRTAAGLDWERACNWVRHALDNCWLTNMLTKKEFLVRSSLLSGFADTNGVNTRANISEVLMALQEAKLVLSELEPNVIRVDGRNASNLGDDSMMMLQRVTYAACVFACLQAHGRPMDAVKQSISRFLCDFLRQKIAACGVFAHLFRKLGTTISEDWEGISSYDLAGKISSVRDQMCTLLRRGGHLEGVELMFRTGVSSVFQIHHNQELQAKLLPVLFSANGGSRLGLTVHRDFWVTNVFQLPVRRLRPPRLTALPGPGAADLAAVLVGEIAEAGMYVNDEVISHVAEHLHSEATEGSRHQTEMREGTQAMWADFMSSLNELEWEQVAAVPMRITVDGTMEPPRCTLWLGPTSVGKSTAACGTIADGDLLTGKLRRCFGTGVCVQAWRTLSLDRNGIFFSLFCPECAKHIGSLDADVGLIQLYGREDDERGSPWLNAEPCSTMVPSATHALRFCCPTLTLPSSVPPAFSSWAALFASRVLKHIVRVMVDKYPVADDDAQMFVILHPLGDDGVRRAYCKATGLTETNVLDTIMKHSSMRPHQALYLRSRALGISAGVALAMCKWKFECSACMLARFGPVTASMICRHVTAEMFSSENGFPHLGGVNIS